MISAKINGMISKMKEKVVQLIKTKPHLMLVSTYIILEKKLCAVEIQQLICLHMLLHI